MVEKWLKIDLNLGSKGTKPSPGGSRRILKWSNGNSLPWDSAMVTRTGLSVQSTKSRNKHAQKLKSFNFLWCPYHLRHEKHAHDERSVNRRWIDHGELGPTSLLVISNMSENRCPSPINRPLFQMNFIQKKGSWQNFGFPSLLRKRYEFLVPIITSLTN